jgi:hypothetical protein
VVKDVSVLRELSKYGTQFSAEVVLPNMPLRGRATSKVPSSRCSRCRAITFRNSNLETSSTPRWGGNFSGSKVRKVWLMGETYSSSARFHEGSLRH